MQYIKDVYRRCDIVSPEVRQSVNGKTRFNSTFGALITILGSSFIMYILINSMLDMIKKKNPDIRQNQNVIIPNISLDNYSLPIAFVLGGGSGVLGNTTYNEKFLNFTPMLVTSTVVNTSSTGKRGVYIPLNYSTCTNDSFGKYKDLYLQSMAGNISSYYCLNFTNVTLHSTQAIPPGSFVEFYFSICSNGTYANGTAKPGKCLTQSALDTRWDRLVAQFFFLDTFVDVSNVKNPVQYMINSKNYWFNRAFYLRNYWNFREITVSSDLGWVLEDKVEIRSFQFDPIVPSEINSKNFDDPNNKFRLTISTNNVLIDYNRSFLKIQNIIANVGGLFNALIILGTILNHAFHTNHSNFILTEKFYDTSNKIAKSKSSISAIPVQTLKLKPHNNPLRFSGHSPLANSNVNQSVTNNNVNRSIDASQVSIFMKNPPNETKFKNTIQSPTKIEKKRTLNEILHIRNFDRYTLSLQCNRKKRNYAKLINDRIEEKMSVEYLFKKYHEIEFMKANLLKPEEIISINHLPKPLLLNEPKEANKRLTTNENLMDIYNNLSNFKLKKRVKNSEFPEIQLSFVGNSDLSPI
jgi:hypothetical protein